MKAWLVVCAALVLPASAAVAAPPSAPPPGLGCPDKDYRQFDFMVGKWQVGPTGKPERPAKSEWVKLGPCAILEHWKPKSGFDGFSLNYFDQADNAWHQHWMDATGDATDYVGHWRNGKLEFTADDISTPQKQKVKLTMTFEPLANGDVRQSGTLSSDNGKTFQPAFDFTYMPDKSAR